MSTNTKKSKSSEETLEKLRAFINEKGGIVKKEEFAALDVDYRKILEFVEAGTLVRIKNGYYTDRIDRFSEEELIARLFPDARLCMESALYAYGYIREKPYGWHLAVDKNTSKSRFKMDYPKVIPYYTEPEALELYRNGMKTVPDMKALVHYVASAWDSETEENSQSTVEIIMAYIAEHLENELRREELAEAVHLNPDYMARLFKKETGLNLKDYIIQQKMQEAQSLLCTTNLPISLIAAKVGYTNFGHFSTSYKKFYHKTPQEERSAAL